MPHALIIDDDETNSASLAEMIADEGFTTATATTLAEAREYLKDAPDIVLVDLMLPDGNGIDLLRDVAPDAVTEVIVVTGHASIECSIEAIRHGASDYLVTPVNPMHLRNALARVARPVELRAEVTGLRNTLRSLGRFGSLVGSSQSMQKLYDAIERVAPTNATVFITGDSAHSREFSEDAYKRAAEPKELLVELLRSELAEYGGLLSLLEDQQNAIVARAPERVLEINTSINDQMRTIQMKCPVLYGIYLLIKCQDLLAAQMRLSASNRRSSNLIAAESYPYSVSEVSAKVD